MAPIYLLVKNFHSGGLKCFLICLQMKFRLIWTHFEVIFHILKPFSYSKWRRRWNGAMSLGPLVFGIDFSAHRQIVVGHRRHRCHVWLHALQIIIIGFLTSALLVRALFVLTIINHTCWTEFVRAFHLQLGLQFRILPCWARASLLVALQGESIGKGFGRQLEDSL